MADSVEKLFTHLMQIFFAFQLCFAYICLVNQKLFFLFLCAFLYSRYKDKEINEVIVVNVSSVIKGIIHPKIVYSPSYRMTFKGRYFEKCHMQELK